MSEEALAGTENRVGGVGRRVRVEGRSTPNAALSPPEWLAIKVGSDESHFNVSLTVRDKPTNRKI